MNFFFRVTVMHGPYREAAFELEKGSKTTIPIDEAVKGALIALHSSGDSHVLIDSHCIQVQQIIHIKNTRFFLHLN